MPRLNEIYRPDKKYIPKVRPLSKVQGVINENWDGDIKPLFMGSVTYNQFSNIQSIISGDRWLASRSAYKSHRKGYVFSDKEKSLADEIKIKCNNLPCALIIKGKGKEKKIVTGFDFSDPKQNTNRYRALFTRDKWHLFSNVEDAKKWIVEQGKEMKGDYHPRIVDEPSTIHATAQTKKIQTDYVEYFKVE